MKKKLNRLLTIFLILIASLGFTDFCRVKNGETPIFALIQFQRSSRNEDGVEEIQKNYVGLLYYFAEEVSISPTQPLFHSPSVKMGIWFIPGIEVYSTYQQ